MKTKEGIMSIRKDIDNNVKSAKEYFEESVKLAHMYQEEYNSFVTIIDETSEVKTDSVLCGVPYALKDNISTSNILTTASSNILKDYVPVYDATVYKKLKESGALLVGKCVLDELAMGGTGLTGHTGIVRNPYDVNRIIGGSSAGCASAVASGIVPFAIGSDTGDSIRKPASFGGIVGFKPTYGRISRHGLFSFASSLDHVGVLTRNVMDASIVTDVVKGQDQRDMTSLPNDNINYTEHLDDSVKGKKLFYIKEIVDREKYKNDGKEINETLDIFFNTLENIKKEGVEVCEESIDEDLLCALFPSYFSISCAEATSNNSNLTGFIFGLRGKADTTEEMMIDARTKGFSEFIKRRFVLGSYILQKENQEKLFKNAQRIRRLVVEKVNELFTKYDGLIMPASGGIAPLIETNSEIDRLSSRYLLLENHLVIANFGGYPSITLPMGFVENMPVGINLTCKAKDDCLCLNIANNIEKITGYKNIVGGK